MAWNTEVQKLSFARTVSCITSIPMVTREFKTPKFKDRSTGRGTQREKDILQTFISQEISCEVLRLLMCRFSLDQFDKNNKLM